MIRRALGVACAGVLMIAGLGIPAGANLEGTEGCTPGYWKNHEESWNGLDPEASVESLVPSAAAYAVGDLSLMEGLNGGGGPGTEGAALILVRAAIAAALNAESGIDFPGNLWGTGGIRDRTNAALASGNRAQMITLAGLFDAKNNLGCPLN